MLQDSDVADGTTLSPMVFLSNCDPARGTPLGLPDNERFGWINNRRQKEELPDIRRIVLTDSGFMTLKQKSQKSCSGGLETLSGYKNTTWVGGAGWTAADWAKSLRAMREDPKWQAHMSYDPDWGFMRYGCDIELRSTTSETCSASGTARRRRKRTAC